MIAEPQTRTGRFVGQDYRPDELWLDVQYAGRHDGSLWLACELTSPPSSAGRKVHLRVTPEVGLALLRELREHQGWLRQGPSLSEATS